MPELVIVPVNTALSKREIAEIITTIPRAISRFYDGVEIVDHISVPPPKQSPDHVGNDVQLFVSAYCNGVRVPTDSRSETKDSSELDGLAAITDYELWFGSHGLNGACIPNTRLTVVSTSRFRQSSILAREGLVKVLTHELGHKHGLEHHLYQNQNGLYCAMISGESIMNLTGRRVVDSQAMRIVDNDFCKECKNSMKRY